MPIGLSGKRGTRQIIKRCKIASAKTTTGPTEEKAVTYQTARRQAFRGEDQSDDHLHTAGSFVPAVSELAFILFLKGRIAPPSALGKAGLMRGGVPAFSDRSTIASADNAIQTVPGSTTLLIADRTAEATFSDRDIP